MASTGGQKRPVPLLATDDSENSSQPSNNIRSPLYVYHAARRAALQLININVLRVFVPLGLSAGAFHWSSIPTSIFNFLAIIPLSAAVSNFSDELSDELGDLLGALINATFGNAVELIVILRLTPQVFWRLIVVYYSGWYSGCLPWRYSLRPVCHARKHFIRYSFR